MIEPAEIPMFKVGGWITAPPNARNPVCRFHDGQCCFADDDPTRCPLCHSTWDVILRTDWHGCERPSEWGSFDRKERVELARKLRAEAARSRDQDIQVLEVDAETSEASQMAVSRAAAA